MEIFYSFKFKSIFFILLGCVLISVITIHFIFTLDCTNNLSVFILSDINVNFLEGSLLRFWLRYWTYWTRFWFRSLTITSFKGRILSKLTLKFMIPTDKLLTSIGCHTWLNRSQIYFTIRINKVCCCTIQLPIFTCIKGDRMIILLNVVHTIWCSFRSLSNHRRQNSKICYTMSCSCNFICLFISQC